MRQRPAGSGRMTPRQIYDYLDRYVVGQTRAKRTVAVAAYNHLKRCSIKSPRQKKLIRKANVLMLGPTGSGKTHIARKLAELLDVPFTVVDATEYTEAGYYGKDVEVMVAELLARADHSVEEAQRGIVFVDEIDKIARRGSSARTGAGSRDIGGEGVQQSLLKLLEGREIFVPMNVTQHWNKHDFVQMDTSDVLFICAGTFSDLRIYAEPEKSVGFGGVDGPTAGRRRRVGTTDLVEYGMMAELLGRLPVVVELDPLSDDDLVKILTGPPDCLVKEYSSLVGMDEVKLRFTDDGLREVVRQANARKLGARGLRSILEQVCHDVMFDAAEMAGHTVDIDAAFVVARLADWEGTP